MVINLDENQIEELIKDRSKIYSLADYKLDCENLSKNDITKKIKNLYEKH